MAKKGKKKTTEVEEAVSDKDLAGKVASIGEFATKDPDAPDDAPEIDSPDEGGEHEGDEHPPEESRPEMDTEVLKARVLSIVSQVGSRGLGEKEKEAFIEEFGFWNGIMFEFLDMGGSLKTVMDRTQVKLSPVKATLIYAGGTLALVALMRPDLVKKAIDSVKPKKPSDRVVRTEPAEPAQEVKQETTPAAGESAEHPAG